MIASDLKIGILELKVENSRRKPETGIMTDKQSERSPVRFQSTV